MSQATAREALIIVWCPLESSVIAQQRASAARHASAQSLPAIMSRSQMQGR